MKTKAIKELKEYGFSNDRIYETEVGFIGLYGKAFFGHKKTKNESQKLRRLWNRILKA